MNKVLQLVLAWFSFFLSVSHNYRFNTEGVNVIGSLCLDRLKAATFLWDKVGALKNYICIFYSCR